MTRVSLTLATALAACSLPLCAAAPEVLGFVRRSCVVCHNSKVKSGDVDLAALQSAKTFDEDREIWEKVVEKMKTGQMPPPGTPRPPASMTVEITRWLQPEFARQDLPANPEPAP